MTVYPTKAHWQTIDSAPKTGERILVAIKNTFSGKHRVEIRRWEETYAKRPKPYWASDDPSRARVDRQDTPDLWAPLPEL